jgi:small conductance mechanosensitive channel
MMRKTAPFFHALTVATILSIVVTATAYAQDEYTAQTTEDPTIPPDQLAIMVMPLTQEELVVEADAWQALVKVKVSEIAAAEIANKYKKAEIETAKDAANAVEKLQSQKEKGKDSQSLEAAASEATEALTAAQAAETNKKTNEAAKAAEEETLQEMEQQAVEGGEEPDADLKTANTGVSASKDVALETAESDDLQRTADAVRQAADAKEQVRATLLDKLNRLREQRTGLVDRANVILKELGKKGGDPAPYKTYLAAVSGVAIDVSDSEELIATIKGWVYSEEGGKRWLRNFVQFALTVFAFWILAAIIGRIIDRILSASRNITQLLRDFAATMVRRVVLVIGIIVGLSALEVDIGPLLAVVGAAGFVVAFALQDTLGNFASGIMILAYRPFDVGHVVEVAGVSGTVKSLNLVSVTINTFDNQVVVVPNNAVWNNVITNVTGSKQRRVDMVFGIGYGDDADKAREIMERIITDHPLTLDDPAPVVRLHELGDSSVNFICRPWVNTADYWSVFWDVTRQVKKEFDANGISIPFPQRDVHIFNAPAPESGEDKS